MLSEPSASPPPEPAFGFGKEVFNVRPFASEPSQAFVQPAAIRHRIVPCDIDHRMVGDPLQAIGVCWLVSVGPHEGGELRHRHRPTGQVVLRQGNPVPVQVIAHLEITGRDFDETEQRLGG